MHFGSATAKNSGSGQIRLRFPFNDTAKKELLGLRYLFEKLETIHAEKAVVNLLHVQEQPVQVAHRLAHGAHVLLLRVQGAATAGRVQPRQHPAPLPRPDHQLSRRLPAPNRRDMPAAHMLEEGLAVGKAQQAEAALKPAPNDVRGTSRKLEKTFLHRRSPVHQPVFGLHQGKLGSHAHLRRL